MLSYLPSTPPFDGWRPPPVAAPSAAAATNGSTVATPVFGATAAASTSSPAAGGTPSSTFSSRLSVLTRQDSVAAAKAKEWDNTPVLAATTPHGRILPGRKHKHHLSRISITDFYKKRGSALNLTSGLVVPSLLEHLSEFVPLSGSVLRVVLEYVNGTGRIVLFAGHTYSADNDLRLNVDFSDKVELFDLTCREWVVPGGVSSTLRWTEAHHERHGDDAAVAVYGNCIYVIGGGGQTVFSANNNATVIDLTSALALPPTNTYGATKITASPTHPLRALRGMRTARDRCAAVGARGQLFVFGGEVGGTPIDSVESYHFASDKWSGKRSLPDPASRMIAFASFDERYIILAGCATDASDSPKSHSARAHAQGSIFGTLPNGSDNGRTTPPLVAASNNSTSPEKYRVAAGNTLDTPPGTGPNGGGGGNSGGRRHHTWRYDVLHDRYDLLAPVRVEEAASGCWWKGAAVVTSIRAGGGGGGKPINQTVPSVDILPGTSAHDTSVDPHTAAFSLRKIKWFSLADALPTCDVRRRLCVFTPAAAAGGGDRKLYLFSEARERKDTQLQWYDEEQTKWVKIDVPDHSPIQSYNAHFLPL